MFDSAIQDLTEDGVIEVVAVRNGTRYRLKEGRQGGNPCQGQPAQVKEGGSACQGGKPNKLVSLEIRSSQGTGKPKVSCQKWFDTHLAELSAQGAVTFDAVAVREAGQAAGYKLNSLYVAANARGLKGATWALAG